MKDSHDYPGLEFMLAKIADRIQGMVPPDVQFLFFLHNGAGLSYGATVDRDDAMLLMAEWVQFRMDDLGMPVDLVSVIRPHLPASVKAGRTDMWGDDDFPR